MTNRMNPLVEVDRYEELIQGRVPACNVQEKLIQKYTRTDAGIVLAAIGVDHPASATVQRYLAEQKYDSLPEKAVFIRGMVAGHFHPEHNRKRDASFHSSGQTETRRTSKGFSRPFEEKAMNLKEREALRQAVMETMEVILTSDLFANAARRSQEDYHFLVSHNVSTMADSVAGRYERILNKVGN